MKKSLGILTILLGLAFSSYSADWPFKNEKRKSKKAKTEKCCEIKTKEEAKVCLDKEKACCIKK